MTQQLLPLLFFIALTCAIFFQTAFASNGLMLAKEYRDSIDTSLFMVTEKYDGVRAVWRDGQLKTRGGHKIHVPDWFLAALPDVDVEGELWLGYGRFDEVSGLARSHQPYNSLWNDIRFVLFDLPSSEQPFVARRHQLESLVSESSVQWLRAAKHLPISSKAELTDSLNAIVAKGGEGLMLNRLDAMYDAKRTNALLKLKPKFDAEAEVIGYQPGKGKYEGLMGSLIVKNEQGRTFKIGSGFSLDERKEPPEIGQWITFAYSGHTSTGLPKFPRFLRLYQPE